MGNEPGSRSDLTFKAEIDLYYDVFVPENVAGPAPLLIAVHGYGAHKRQMMREAKAIAPPNFLIASLQAPHEHFRRTEKGVRTGFGWLTDHKPEKFVAIHQKFINDVINKLASEGISDEKKVFLCGFSQACALNFRYAFTFPQTLRGVIGVCGGIPGDLETNPNYKRSAADTFYLYGSDDEFYTQEKFAEFDDKLRSLLPNYRSKHYLAKHEITDEMREDMRKFLKEFV